MGHYDEHYEEQDRISSAYNQKRIEEKSSEIRIEIIKNLPDDISFKGYYPNLVEKLAACRVHKFNEVALDNLLTEIVKHLHKI